ncbi:hypothetical protein N0V95_006045 [Ascochyta clinopodiicola]|nr:hypothetical protein N0V95_006045 [Ascochyta clinopodiicola]
MGFISTWRKAIMGAKDKGTTLAGPAETPAPTATDLDMAPKEAQPTHDTGARKRPRETDSPRSSRTSLPQSPSEHSPVVSEERARKKARFDRENKLESLMIKVCLEKIEGRQIDRSQARLTTSASDIMTRDLKNIFRKLKIVNAEGYTEHIQQLDTACVTLAGLKARDSRTCKTELDVAQREVRKAVFNFFNRNGLVRLHAQLKGNGRWQAVLRSLQLPLTALRNLDANLRFQKNDTERKLNSEVSDLLAWLTPHEVQTPGPSSSRDVSTRNNEVIVMRAQLDEQTILNDGSTKVRTHGDEARSAQEQVSSLNRDNAQQPHPTPKLYVLSDTHFNQLLARTSSTGTTTKADQQRPEPSNTTEQPAEDQENESAISESTQTTETQWGPRHDAAMVAARSAPQQMANIRAVEELKQKAATFSKLQAYGQAYSIVIGQLKDAQSGGPSPTFVEDLQMPDAEACYYRLESLWSRVLQAINDRGVEHLRANIDLFYTFAICMREAHCLLRVLQYYGCDVSQLIGTGWDLEDMEILDVVTDILDFKSTFRNLRPSPLSTPEQLHSLTPYLLLERLQMASNAMPKRKQRPILL